jgi:hypothetical protein
LTATIYSPFHPMQGRELRVTSRSRNPEFPVTVVDEPGTGLRLPAWMVAPEAAHYHLAEQAAIPGDPEKPVVSLNCCDR